LIVLLQKGSLSLKNNFNGYLNLINVDFFCPSGVDILELRNWNSFFSVFFVGQVRIDKRVSADHGERFLEFPWCLYADSISNVGFSGEW
jgi:hypothetical protein